jgi:hypothetical protein
MSGMDTDTTDNEDFLGHDEEEAFEGDVDYLENDWDGYYDDGSVSEDISYGDVEEDEEFDSDGEFVPQYAPAYSNLIREEPFRSVML